MTKITLKDYRAKCQEVDKLKNIVEKLQDQISRMVENNWNTDFSAENSDYAKKIAKLKRDVNRHHKWMWKYYNRMRTAEGLNVQYLDEIQELKGIVSSEMRRNRELEKEIKSLRDQVNPDQSSGINPDYDSNLNDVPQQDINPDYDVPMTPMSCTPGWGQLGFLDPDLSFMKIRPTSKITIKSELKPAPSSDITTTKKTKIAKKLRWDDYHTGG